MEVRDLLAGLAVFEGCSDAALEDLAQLAEIGVLEPGEILFEEGDPATAAFVIARGSMRISRALLVDSDRTLAVLGAGTFFGEAGIIDGSPRSAQATAIAESELVALPRGEMTRWLEQHPTEGARALRHLTQQMMGRLRATNDLLRDTVTWGLEVSGASLLSLDRLITQRASLRVGLMSGREVVGRLVRVDAEDDGRRTLWIASPSGEIHLVPYHGVEDLVADVDLDALHREASSGEEA